MLNILFCISIYTTTHCLMQKSCESFCDQCEIEAKLPVIEVAFVYTVNVSFARSCSSTLQDLYFLSLICFCYQYTINKLDLPWSSIYSSSLVNTQVRTTQQVHAETIQDETFRLISQGYCFIRSQQLVDRNINIWK